MLKPNDVFIPGKLPLETTNVYAPRTRENVQTRFEKILSRGLVPIVFGEYGVGKTSMARFVVREDESKGLLVNIESVASKSLSDVFRRCLELLGYSVQTKRIASRSDSNTQEQSGQAKIGVGWIESLVASKRIKTKGSTNHIEE